jgi:cardiolipin synthase
MSVNLLETLISIVFALIIIATIYIIIMENRNPIKSIAWIIMLVLLPVIGFIVYFFFGRNYRKRKIISKKSIKRIKRYSKQEFEKKDISSYSFDEKYRNMVTLLYNNNEAIPYDNNEVEIYTSGFEAFRSVFEEIKKAKHHVHVQFFIIENDVVGNRLKELLIKKAKEGVEVRLIYDSLGCWKLTRKFINSLKNNGVQVGSFLKATFPFFSNKVNYRNHRKIVVIDGKIGFVGGMNAADRYVAGDNLGNWRDTLIKIEGNAVHGLQNSFLVDWHFVNRTYIVSSDYYPEVYTQGNKLVQTVTSAPDSDWEAILQSFCKIISNAKKYVYLQTPYFLPPESLLNTMKIAALSGIDVRLLLAERSDAAFTNIASRSFLREIMEAGVKVYFYGNGFIHSKTIVADDEISSVGSTNLDFRSFELHFEINSFIYSEEFAMEMKRIYEQDLKSSTLLELSTWKRRVRWQKFKESFARLFSPLL